MNHKASNHAASSHRTRRSFVGQSLAAAGAVALGPGVLGLSRGAKGERIDEAGDSRAFLLAVRRGDLVAVRTMLAKDGSLAGVRDDAGRSAFAVALLHHHADVAKAIREAGHQPDLHESSLALDWDRFNVLAEADQQAVNSVHPLGGTAMTAAALGGAGSGIWRVYAQCGTPNPDRPSAATPSPVRAAMDFPDLAAAEMCAAGLLGNDADPNQPEPDGRTALHVAADRGSMDITEMLIRKGAVVNARDAAGRTPADLATSAGHLAVADLIANDGRVPRDFTALRRATDARGAPCSQPNWDGVPIKERVALVGSAHGNLDAVREGLRRDPRLAHAVAMTSEGAVEAGAHMGNQQMVELLLEHGAPESLPTAAMRGDATRVRALLADEPQRIHERGAHDYPLLWFPVIGRGHVEVASILLDAGADVEQQNHLGTTGLHMAAMGGQIDLAALYIEHGADVNRVGRKFGGRRETPLQAAQGRSHADMVTLLRQHGATG